MSDQELSRQLLKAGFDVPDFVIATWGKPTSYPNRRWATERWLRKRNGLRTVGPVPFPQWLAMFDIDIRRRLHATYQAQRNVESVRAE